MDDLSTLSDDELVRRYLSTDGAPGDPEVEALIAEMATREIDF